VCGTVPGSLPAHLYHNKWFVLYVCRTHTEYGSLYIPGRPCFVVERAFETSWMRKCELSPPHHQEDTNTHCPLRTCLLIKEEQQRHARRGLGGGGHPGSPQRERVLCVGSQAMQKRAAFAVLQNAKTFRVYVERTQWSTQHRCPHRGGPKARPCGVATTNEKPDAPLCLLRSDDETGDKRAVQALACRGTTAHALSMGCESSLPQGPVRAHAGRRGGRCSRSKETGGDFFDSPLHFRV
jgi:hypothetical protein